MRSIIFYGAKGGQGTTVTTVLAAMAMAANGERVALVDGPDMAAVLGVPALAVADYRDREVADGLTLVKSSDSVPENTTVILVDAGTNPGYFAHDEELAEARRVLVTTGCYLALSRAVFTGPHEYAVVIAQPGRSLRPADVASVVGAEILATVWADPALARSVDAGLLLTVRHGTRGTGELGSLADCSLV